MTAKPLPKTPKNVGGRPSRNETLRRAIANIGVDPSLVDPKRILAAIAVDEAAPGTARVAACRILLAHQGGIVPALPAEVEAQADDELTIRALRILAARGAH